MASGNSGSLLDKQNASYVDSPTRAHKTAKEVVVSNSDSSPVPVSFSLSGEIQYLIDSTTIASGSTTSIMSLIVPSGKVVELKSIQASGDGFGLYNVKVNNSTVLKARTYYTDFNAKIDLGDKKMTASEDIKLEITNRSGESCDYDATLTYRIYDA